MIKTKKAQRPPRAQYPKSFEHSERHGRMTKQHHSHQVSVIRWDRDCERMYNDLDRSGDLTIGHLIEAQERWSCLPDERQRCIICDRNLVDRVPAVDTFILIQTSVQRIDAPKKFVVVCVCDECDTRSDAELPTLTLRKLGIGPDGRITDGDDVRHVRKSPIGLDPDPNTRRGRRAIRK
jgi:hypothetical protein